MLQDLLKNLNWIDVVIALFLIWCVFRAVKNGLIKELFKFFGLVFALFITFHYYYDLASFFVSRTPLTQATAEVSVFIVLWLLGTLVFRFIETGIFLLFTIEANSLIDKWGSVLFAIIRSAIVGSMLLYMLLLFQHSYLQKLTLQSFSHRGLLQVAPKVYGGVYRYIIYNFFPDERPNAHIKAVIKGEYQPSKLNKYKMKQKKPAKADVAHQKNEPNTIFGTNDKKK